MHLWQGSSARKHTNSDLVNAVVRALDVFLAPWVGACIDAVMIESQLHARNPAAVHVNVILHSYFACKYPLTSVQVVQAASKFKLVDPRWYENLPDFESVKETRSAKYTERKKYAVQVCLHILHVEKDTQAATQLTGERKKDDLADSYLLALQALDV